MTGFQDGNEYDARAWPTSPAPEPDLFPPVSLPPPPQPVLWGHYADVSLQARAGVSGSTDPVLAMTAIDQLLLRERQAAEDQRAHEARMAEGRAMPASAQPHQPAQIQRAPARTAAQPAPPQAQDLCCQSAAQVRQALEEQRDTLRAQRRGRAAALGRQAGMWLGLGLAWRFVLPPLLGALPFAQGLLRFQGLLGAIGWLLPALALGQGLRALHLGLRRDAAERATEGLLACWVRALPTPDALLGPSEAESLCAAARLQGINLQLRFFDWQVPARRRQPLAAGQQAFVLHSTHFNLGQAPTPEQARLSSEHPRQASLQDKFLDRVERLSA